MHNVTETTTITTTYNRVKYAILEKRGRYLIGERVDKKQEQLPYVLFELFGKHDGELNISIRARADSRYVLEVTLEGFELRGNNRANQHSSVMADFGQRTMKPQ